MFIALGNLSNREARFDQLGLDTRLYHFHFNRSNMAFGRKGLKQIKIEFQHKSTSLDEHTLHSIQSERSSI